MKSLIQKLVETPSPSGYETRIREVIRLEVEPFAEETRVDNLGNLIVRRGTAGPGGKKIMLAAHMDEIGVMVTHLDENGFLRFLPIGGVSPNTCVGSRVRFLNDQVGLIYTERLEDPGKTLSLERMYIDIGATRKEDVSIKVGDVAAFERPFEDLGKRMISKAMDDRIAVAILIETLRRLSEMESGAGHELYFVFSVQEEVGTRGATTAAFAIDPDLALAVDVTASGDTPRGARIDVGLGKGPAIKVRDSGMLSDPRVVSWMASTAEKAGIPYQLEVLEAGSTDARAMQLSRAGVPAGCLSIPCRYIHSPSEMVDEDDVQNSVRLLVDLLSQPFELS
ncbi:MAG: M42 family peptidase [Chloroflexota bacterium]|nr:MAG: M42 family peptidase [Chloroflexota bacterium]